MAPWHRMVWTGVVVSLWAGSAGAEPAKSLVRPGMPTDGYREAETIRRSRTVGGLAALSPGLFRPGGGVSGRAVAGTGAHAVAASPIVSGGGGGSSGSGSGGGDSGGGGALGDGVVGRTAHSLLGI